jgi:hypothetical protein
MALHAVCVWRPEASLSVPESIQDPSMLAVSYGSVGRFDGSRLARQFGDWALTG